MVLASFWLRPGRIRKTVARFVALTHSHGLDHFSFHEVSLTKQTDCCSTNLCKAATGAARVWLNLFCAALILPKLTLTANNSCIASAASRCEMPNLPVKYPITATTFAPNTPFLAVSDHSPRLILRQDKQRSAWRRYSVSKVPTAVISTICRRAGELSAPNSKEPQDVQVSGRKSTTRSTSAIGLRWRPTPWCPICAPCLQPEDSRFGAGLPNGESEEGGKLEFCEFCPSFSLSSAISALSRAISAD